VVVNELELDLARGTVRFRNQRVELTPSEFRILRHLAVNAGRVVANEVLVRDALGYTTTRKDASDILKVHIRHLREKIEPQPSKPMYLLNVRGLGYMLERRKRGGRVAAVRTATPTLPEEEVTSGDEPTTDLDGPIELISRS
jgi:DNA-binding response OmpR family regulator